MGNKEKYDLGSATELIKNIGIIAGSLGSLAVLFFWIGDAIIVARLRAYNLYGVVHYTDEYVKEAGFQFLQDIFTFFQRWDLILLFVLAVGLLIALIPVGPFSRGQQDSESSASGASGKKFAILGKIRHRGIHYFLFFLLALSASVSLTADWGVRNLFSDIICQERLLTRVNDTMIDSLLIFTRRGNETGNNEFKKRFLQRLTFSVSPTREWLCRSLAEFYSGPSCVADPGLLPAMVRRFQNEFEIAEDHDFRFDGDFERSSTFRVLRDISVNNKLNRELRLSVESALQDVRQLLSANLTSEEDFSSLVIIPANYQVVNASIMRAELLRSNILAFFKPGNEQAKSVMDDLSRLEEIRFGSLLLSYSFWILIGLLGYLLLNIPAILKFKHWETGYFFLMLFFFLTIAVTLPSAYGKYKFEFNIQKLNDIVFSGDGTSENPIQKKIADLQESKAALYILGPTRGKEVIIGVVKGEADPASSVPQIMMLDREAYTFMNVEPVRVTDIPEIIRLLRIRK